MTPQELQLAVEKALENKLGDFFIDQERHKQDHQFITGVRQGVDKVKGGSLWFLGLAIGGFFVWAIKSWIVAVVKGIF